MNLALPIMLIIAGSLGVLGLIMRIMRRPRAIVLPAHLPPAQREAARRIGFRGTGNFRDLGGYPTEDGRRVRWGVLYRSGQLHHLNDADLAAFARLDLCTLIDFRSPREKSEQPNRLPGDLQCRIVEIPIFDESSSLVGELRARMERGDFEGVDAAALLTDANRQFVTHFNAEYRRFFQELLAARGAPVLFHCSAGKDRTGFAAALTLRMLGVPQQTVLADYMLSKHYLLRAHQRDLSMLQFFRGANVAAIVRQLLAVEPAYLQAAFDTISQQYGSFEAYLYNGLGLSADDLTQLRDWLLEH